MSVKDKAVAIDRFVRTIKASGVYDDIKAACIMAGWTNLAGALTPLKGAAPTNGGGLFQDADLDPGIGLKGNGSSKYLDSNRSGDDDPKDDNHLAVYVTSNATANGAVAGNGNSIDGLTQVIDDINNAFLFFRNNSASGASAFTNATGLAGVSRSVSSSISVIGGGSTATLPLASVGNDNSNINIFARRASNAANLFWNGSASWYSIGSATDLAALDSAVSTLMADLRAIDEAGFDRDAVRYIRNVEAADGSYLETGVKQAINAFVVGCKADSAGYAGDPTRTVWDAIKASCILCGARTISGALVPLAGTAPTGYGDWASGDYDRSSGLKGNGSTKYLDSNRANNADGQDDSHLAIYKSDTTSAVGPYFIGDFSAGSLSAVGQNAMYLRSNDFFASGGFASSAIGLHAASRQESATVTFKRPGFSVQTAVKSSVGVTVSLNAFVFAGNNAGSPSQASASRLAFYSIGSAIPDLALLDNRVSTLVSQIAAAI